MAMYMLGESCHTRSPFANLHLGLCSGYITYGITLVFYASVFPRLARNTQRTKDAREKLDQGLIDTTEYEQVESLERNRLSNISTAHSNCTLSKPYTVSQKQY